MNDKLETWYENRIGHTNYITFLNGSLVSAVNGEACYAEITQHTKYYAWYHSKKLDEIYICFGPTTIFNEEAQQRWCDWVVNESQYKDAFITKDADVCGIFEVNTSCERYVMYAGMIVLRHAFEIERWATDWCAWVDMGFTPHEAYALTSSVVISDDKLYDNTFNSNHFIIKASEPFEIFEGKGYVNPTGDQCHTTGVDMKGRNLSKIYGSMKEWDSPINVGFKKTEDSLKEMGEYNLNIMKGNK